VERIVFIQDSSRDKHRSGVLVVDYPRCHGEDEDWSLRIERQRCDDVGENCRGRRIDCSRW
jgi:hypothetical protein